MRPRHLRVPRSLLRRARETPSETPDPPPSGASAPCLNNTTDTQDASSASSDPLLESHVIHLAPLHHVALSLGPLADLAEAIRQLPFQQFGDHLTYQGLQAFCQEAPLHHVIQIESHLKACYFKCTQAVHVAQRERENFNLQAQQALHLYEQASMTHEDRLHSLKIQWATQQNTRTRSFETLRELETTCHQLNEALETSHKALQEAEEEKERAQGKQNRTTWKCTATLQLISQMHDALREFVFYRERLMVYRSTIEVKRREQHNRLQELKRNLRVFCRIRPALEEEASLPSLTFTVSKDETQLHVIPPDTKTSAQKTASLDPTKETCRFCFDRVFSPHCSQEQVFEEVSSLIQSALDGFNVALFAYGQTGSGKTFTMEGEGGWEKHVLGGKAVPSPAFECLSSNSGIIPRAVDLVFRVMEQSLVKGWNYKTELSILEIYNETLRDLLANHKASKSTVEHTTVGTGSRPMNPLTHMSNLCEIKLDAKGNTTLVNAVSVPVYRSTDVYRCLLIAQRQRSVASTACNQHSSRSHCVFQLKIRGQCLKSSQTFHSTLSMVDLAGCERVEKSLVTGERLREAQHINKSLSCLGDVIHAIAHQKSHIPFRNSKLTMLLKDSLGGQAKTLMFVNISPLAFHFKESLASLRFAVKANSCNMS